MPIKTVVVCHFTSVHPHNDTRLVKQCTSIADAGYQLYLVATNCETTFNGKYHNIGIDNTSNSRLMRFLFVTYKIYKTAKKINADIYHFHDPELILYGLILKIIGKRVIYDVHEDVPNDILTKEWIPSSIIRKIVSKVIEKLENFVSRKMDVVITATPYIRDRFRNMGCNAIDVKNYPLVEELYSPEIRWEDKEDIACYVGGISTNRGIYEIVEAICKTNCRLVLCGYMPANILTSLQNKTNWNNVVSNGYTNRKQVREILGKSRIGLVILHAEKSFVNAYPIKLFEYMSAGIPVIASNFPLWREIIETNNCGICVDPLNVDEIAAAIQWVVNNSAEAELLGRNGRIAIEEKYNWENEKAVLLATYLNVMSQELGPQL